MSTGTPRAQAPVAPVRFRRNADRLTPGQLELLREAFEALYGIADDRGYGYQAGIHGLPLPIGCDNAHGTPTFCPGTVPISISSSGRCATGCPTRC
jgi:hypothetical protein